LRRGKGHFVVVCGLFFDNLLFWLWNLRSKIMLCG
jgi:hypothetical protein